MLLDTCVLIDVLRGNEAAVAFVGGLPKKPALSVITVTEILAGVRNARERKLFEQFAAACEAVPIDLESATLAGEYVSQYSKSHSVDPIDAHIAATAKVSGLPLATLNLKHFPMLEGLKRPYDR